jgi:hypothetical protein
MRPGAHPSRSTFAALSVIAAVPGVVGQVAEGTEGDGWVHIGPDQSDTPGRVVLLQSFIPGYSSALRSSPSAGRSSRLTLDPRLLAPSISLPLRHPLYPRRRLLT